ncbi:MAG: response regulator transcription factor [Clostridia bacterium]|nr:response regulator transcription factor [Clostridia bacterium]
MSRILIVEDDPAIARIEKDYLELNRYEVKVVEDGVAGLNEALSGSYDMVLLDVMLPGMNGFDVCARLRDKTDIPILLVTARSEDIDKIRGLGLGADDYIEKPFSPSVLVARINAHLARYARLTSGTSQGDELCIGAVKLTKSSREVTVGGSAVELKNKEYELLLFLMTNAGNVFDRETIYERVWGMDAMGESATVAVHINRLRDKLERDPASPEYILTVRGAGYRFRARD